MKKFVPALFALVATLLPAQDLLPGAALDPAQADDLRIQVKVTRTNLEGQPREELGEAIADSLSAALMRRGHRVLSAKATDPDIIIESRLVGEDGYYHFSLKKIEPETGEALAIHELSRQGGMEVVFPMAVQALQGVTPGENVPEVETAITGGLGGPHLPALGGSTQAGPDLPSFPAGAPPQLAEHRERRFEAAVAAEIARREEAAFQRKRAEALKVLEQPIPKSKQARKESAPAPKPQPRRRVRAELVRAQVGTVVAVNDAWKFCIVEPHPDARIRESDLLDTLYTEDSRQPYARLVVTRETRDGSVVASFGMKQANRHLFPGEPVYGWVVERFED